MAERLTTLANVKAWLDIDSDSSDALLTRAIDAASQFALNYMNRESMGAKDYTENFLGNGKSSTLLHNWPIIGISLVGINGNLIPESTVAVGGLPTRGYRVSDRRQSPQSVQLYGYNFLYQAPCQVVYKAGYETFQDFTLSVSEDSGKVTVQPREGEGLWVADQGVTIDNVIAVKTSSQDPSAGEYYVDEWGLYTFSLDDVSKVAVISFSYCPFAVSFGVTELVGEWIKRKDRIGVASKALSGGVSETVTFTQSDMNEAVRSYLQAYRNVVPF